MKNERFDFIITFKNGLKGGYLDVSYNDMLALFEEFNEREDVDNFDIVRRV